MYNKLERLLFLIFFSNNLKCEREQEKNYFCLLMILACKTKIYGHKEQIYNLANEYSIFPVGSSLNLGQVHKGMVKTSFPYCWNWSTWLQDRRTFSSQWNWREYMHAMQDTIQLRIFYILIFIPENWRLKYRIENTMINTAFICMQNLVSQSERRTCSNVT